MILKIDQSFVKDTKKIKDKKLIAEILKCIEEIKTVDRLDEISGIKKLTGHKNYYRIRTGDYRIGIFLNQNEVELIRFLHRKDIYKFFP